MTDGCERSQAFTIEIVKRLNADYGVNPDDLFLLLRQERLSPCDSINGLIGFTHSTAVSNRTKLKILSPS
jgi:hypothetical protein